MRESVSESSAILSDLVIKESMKILHVDDDPSFLRVAKQILELQGEFEVETACSVEEAVEKMKEASYDAVVADYQMPGKDGLQFLKELREKNNRIPFIIFTGRSREEVAIEALKLGADNYINKHDDTETAYAELAHDIRDAVDKKRAEEALRKSEESLRLSLRAAEAGMWNYDFREKKLTWSPELYAVYGLRPNNVKPSRDSWLKYVHPRDRDRVNKEVSNAIEGKRDYLTDYRTVWPDGTIHWISEKGRAFYDGKGLPLRMTGISIDVTRNKQREEEFNRLALIVESSDDAIIGKTLDGTIISWNLAAQNIYGYTPEEVKGKHISIIVPPELQSETTAILEKIKRGEYIRNYITVRKSKDGKRIDVSLTVSPIRDANGAIVGASTIARDITEDMRARRRLEESEQKYRKLFEGAPLGISLIQGDRIISCNSKELELFGLERESSVVGHSISEFISKEYLPKFLELSQEVTRSKTVSQPVQFETTRPDGFKLWIESRVFSSPYREEECTVVLHTDITGRKKAEQELHASLERYRSFIELTEQLGWTTNANGEVLEDIPSFRRFTGQTYEEVKGWGWSKALHPDDLERTTRIWEEATRTKSKYEAEYRLRRHDGAYRYFMARGVPVFNEDGGIREWVGTCIDITERKKADQVLKESEEKYRSLVELAPDGILAVNAEGIVTSANRSFLRLVGYDSEEGIVGKPFQELKTIRVEDIPRFQEMFSSLMNGESALPVEFFYFRRDGTSRWAELHPGLLTKEGNPVGVQVLVRDVSERKDAEKLILENQQRFAALFIGNPEATVYTDPSFHIIDVNPSFASLFRYLSSEVKGKHLTDVVVPERLIAESKMLEKKAAEGYATHNTVRKRKGGSLVPVSVSCAPIFIQDKLAGYISVYKDISEQTNAQRKLTMMNEKLQVVGGLTRHDVRNKLSAIVGNAYLAKKETAGNNRVREYLREIEKAVQQSAAIFDFAKTYEMLGIEELTHTDVEKTIKEAVSLCSDLKGAKVVNDCHGLYLLADSLLQQLFYNLIDNSLKYGQKTTRIRVHYEKSGKNDLVLVYEDDGVGIPAGEKPKLFNEGHSTGGSTGYGLYLIKKMTEVYDWTIQEEGEPGKGARFVIKISGTNTSGKENYRIM
jgi:PAS domain S-box-containing protein